MDPEWGLRHYLEDLEPPDEAETRSRLYDFATRLAQQNKQVAEWVRGSSGEKLRTGQLQLDEAVEYLTKVSSASPGASHTRLARGDLVDQFKVVSRLGQGAMGEVYLAQDTQLGRPVALKIVSLIEGASDQDTFLAEARATAAVRHPNIVVLYAAGRFERRAYLALEYVAGKSLAARGRTSNKLAVRWVAEVAAALEAAHDAGLVHCDIKPANIVVGTDGRARVVDFGLARWGPKLSGGGTAAYLAPERWWGTTAEAPADIWSLGCTFYELCYGKLPFSEEQRIRHLSGATLRLELPDEAQLPEGVEAWLRRSLDPDPAKRPTATETRNALNNVDLVSATNSDLSPFRGLERYEEKHAAIFFGREDETQKLHEHLHRHPVSLVVGLSGAGKSSLVRAGLMPLLRDVEPWKLVTLRPGECPLENLRGLLVSNSLAAERDLDLSQLNLLLHRFVEETDQSVLIFVDQLEELFTLGVEQTTASEFIEAISNATNIASPRVRVLCAVRDDFLPQLAALSVAANLVNSGFHLRPPGRAALIRAVEQAARSRGYRFDPPELAMKLADDVLRYEAGLPLLQVACTALWERRNVNDRTLSVSVYEEIGGVQGSLAAHAESVLHGLNPQAVAEARRLLLGALNSDGTRRRLRLKEVRSEDAQFALQKLTQGRLLIPRRDLESEESDYEIVHESLAQQWPRLQEWLRTDKDKIQFEADLRQMASLWIRRGRSEDDVPRARSFAALEYRIDSLSPDLTDEVEEFVEAARKQDRLHKRQNRFRAITAFSIVTAVAVAALIAAGIFREQSNKIDRAAANLGQFTLELHFYDLDPKTHASHPLSAAELPNISWRLYEPDRNNPEDPGDPLDPRFVTTRTATSAPEYRREIVNARGAPAFIKVHGRGRNTDCAPSVIKLRWLPGHAEWTRGEVHNVELWIPTCDASMGLMKKVPAGPYISGGAGEPPTSFESYIAPEVVIDLPEYWLDTTEVSNQEFAIFAQMKEHTGLGMPSYPKSEDAFSRMPAPDSPVTQVTLATARTYCRYMGKRIPTSQEWEKAARGGLDLGEGVPNPHPKRNVPWGVGPEGPLNIQGGEDGFPSVSGVFALRDGSGPYGHLNLAGNVAEWTNSEPQGDVGRGFRVVRGGSWDSPRRWERWTVLYEDKRAAIDTDLGIGCRCAHTRG